MDLSSVSVYIAWFVRWGSCTGHTRAKSRQAKCYERCDCVCFLLAASHIMRAPSWVEHQLACQDKQGCCIGTITAVSLLGVS